MKRLPLFLALLALAACRGSAPPAERATAVRGPFEVWSLYRCELEPKTVRGIKTELPGGGVLTDLAADGAWVEEGEVVATFDVTQLQQEVVRLEQELAVADADARSVTRSELPLEEQELALAIVEKEAGLEAEKEYLVAVRELATQGHLSDKEVEQQSRTIERLEQELSMLRMKQGAQKRFDHPARTQQVEARLKGAREAYRIARNRMSAHVVAAPLSGYVSHKLLPFVDGTRPPRVGDTIFPSQVFMVIPDADELMAVCLAPEEELERTPPGASAKVSPTPLANVTVEGKVDWVARIVERDAAGAKRFRFKVALASSPEGVRPGMTATVRVLGYRAEQAVTLPRRAVRWDGREAFVTMADGSRRRVTVGPGNEEAFEIREGIAAGDEVRLDG